MGAGYTPIAATLVSDHVMEPILQGSKVVMSGHTLSANPQSCATSLAVLEYLEQNKIIQGVNRKKSVSISQHLNNYNLDFRLLEMYEGKVF